MPTLITVAALLTLPISAFAQLAAIPTFTIISNDVAQSSIMVFHLTRMSEARVTVKFAFTETGAKRLEEFYRVHAVDQDVRFQIGSFERVFNLDDRKHFDGEGFWRLPEGDASALEAGLRGRK